MDMPLDNPRWERYAQERAAGRTQRQAMLAAYPAALLLVSHDATLVAAATGLTWRISGVGDTFCLQVR